MRPCYCHFDVPRTAKTPRGSRAPALCGILMGAESRAAFPSKPIRNSANSDWLPERRLMTVTGESRRNAVRPLGLGDSFNPPRRDKRTGHSSFDPASTGSSPPRVSMWRKESQDVKNKWENQSLTNQHSQPMASRVHLAIPDDPTLYSKGWK